MLNGCLGRRIKINSRRIENCIIQELPREKIKNFMQYTKSNLVVLNTDVFTIVLVVKLNWNNIGLLQYIQIKSRRFSVPENKLKVFSNLTTFLKECEKCAKTISTPPPAPSPSTVSSHIPRPCLQTTSILLHMLSMSSSSTSVHLRTTPAI